MDLCLLHSNCNAETQKIIRAYLINCDSSEHAIDLLNISEHSEVFRTLNSNIDFVNVVSNLDIFEKIIQSTKNYLYSPLKHHQHKELREHLSYNNDLVCYLWGVAVFLALVDTPSVITTDNIYTKKIMISVLFAASEKLHVMLKVLQQKDNKHTHLKRFLFKKYIHIILHKIAEEHPQLIKIAVEKKEEILTLAEFLKSDLSKTQDPRFNKITTISIAGDFKPNIDKKFNIGNIKPHFIKLDNTYYVYRLFYFSAVPVIIENNCKPDTEITPDFILAASRLASTRFVIDFDMLDTQQNLVEIELKNLFSYAEQLTSEQHVDIADVRLLVGQLIKETQTLKYKRHFLQNKLKKLLDSDTSTDKIIVGLGRNREITSTGANLFKKNKEEKELDYITRELQGVFSKIYTLTTFLGYAEYLKTANIKTVTFIPRADFRGRLYYDSIASIQSL